MKKGLIGLLGCLALAGCGRFIEEPIHTRLFDVPYATNNDTQYQNSKNGPDLIVKQPLTKANLSGFYDLPPPPKPVEVDVKPPTD